MGPVTMDLAPFVSRHALVLGSERPRAHEMEGTLVFADLSGFTAMSERLTRLGRVGSEEVSDVVSATFAMLLAEAWDLGGALLTFGGDALLLAFTGMDHAPRGVRAAARMRHALRRAGTLQTSAGRVRLRMSTGVHSGVLPFLVVGRSSAELLVAGPAATAVVEAEAAAGPGQIVLSPATASLVPASCTGAPCRGGVLLARAPAARAVPHAPDPGGSRSAPEFLSTALRSHLSQGGTDSEHRQAGIAFALVGGCDPVAVGQGVEALAGRLHEVVGAVQAACDEHGVCLLASDVYRDGVKLLLTSGVPSALGADEERLLHAARAFTTTDHGLPVRVGIHAGPVFAGVVGPSFRQTYTVMGDTVNVAARVASRAEPGSILVTPEVLDRCAVTFAVAPITPFEAKGKAARVHASRLGEPLGRRIDGSASTEGLPLLEREEELASLLAHLDRIEATAGAAVAVLAPPGIGATRLFDEAAALRPELHWLRTTSSPTDTVGPFSTIRPLLRAALDLPSAPHPDDPTRLLDLIRGVDPSALQWAPLVATVLGVPVATTPEADALEPRARSSRVRAAMGQLLLAVFDRPTVLVVEHLEHADHSSLQLLSGVLPRLLRRHIAVITSGEELPDWQTEELSLAPLSTRASIDLAVLAGRGRVLGHQGAAIARRSAGLPRLVVELAEAVVAGDDDDALPASIEQLAAARLDALEPSLRSAARSLSVLGTAFPVDRAPVVLGRGAEDVLPQLVGIIDVHDDTARFRSSVICEAAHQGLPRRQRAELHGRLADALAQGGDAEARAAEIAFHAAEAGRDDLSWHWGMVAAEVAWAAGAATETSDLVRRAVRAAGRLHDVPEERLGAAWGLLGTALWALGDLARADEPLRRALRLVRDPVERSTLWMRSGLLAQELGRPVAAARRHGRGLREIEGVATVDAERSRVRLELGLVHLQVARGHLASALRTCDDVLARAVAAEDAFGVGHAHTYAAFALTRLGRPDGFDRSRAALNAFEASGDLRTTGVGWVNLGVAYGHRGDVRQEEHAYERGATLLEQAGEGTLTAVARANLSDVRRRQGRLAEAERLAGHATAALRAAGSAYAEHAEIRLAEARVALARLDEAEAILDEAAPRWVDPANLAASTTVRAAIALGRGDSGLAVEVLKGASDVEGLIVRARARLVNADIEGAQTDAEDALARSRSAANPFEELVSLLLVRRIAGAAAIDEEIERLRHELGLDDLPPLPGPPE